MIGAYCAYVAQAQRLAVSRRGAARPRGLRRARLVVERWLVRPLYAAAVRHAGRHLGPEPAAAQVRRSDVRPRLQEPDEPLGGTVEVLGADLSALSAGADRGQPSSCSAASCSGSAGAAPAPASRRWSAIPSWRARSASRCAASARRPSSSAPAWPGLARRADRAARAGAAVHGARPRPDVVLRAGRRRTRQRRRAAVTGARVIGGTNSVVSALSDSTGGYSDRARAGDPVPVAQAARHPCALEPRARRARRLRSRAVLLLPLGLGDFWAYQLGAALPVRDRRARHRRCAGAAPASCRSARALFFGLAAYLVGPRADRASRRAPWLLVLLPARRAARPGCSPSASACSCFAGAARAGRTSR